MVIPIKGSHHHLTSKIIGHYEKLFDKGGACSLTHALSFQPV